jgi:hypothetical protein
VEYLYRGETCRPHVYADAISLSARGETRISAERSHDGTDLRDAPKD